MVAGVKPWPGFVYDFYALLLSFFMYQKFTLESSKFSFVPLAIYILGETTIVNFKCKFFSQKNRMHINKLLRIINTRSYCRYFTFCLTKTIKTK